MIIQIFEDFTGSRSIIAPPINQSEGHTMPRNAKPGTTVRGAWMKATVFVNTEKRGNVSC